MLVLGLVFCSSCTYIRVAGDDNEVAVEKRGEVGLRNKLEIENEKDSNECDDTCADGVRGRDGCVRGSASGNRHSRFL